MASELESVEKLRKYTLYDRGERYSACINADELADEIEREVAGRFMPAPVDMDGVPIRIGDTVRKVDERVPIKVMSLMFYEDCVYVNECGMNPNLLRHFKPRTVEDVLREFAAEYHNAASSPYTFDSDGMIERCAAELRGMMEADE